MAEKVQRDLRRELIADLQRVMVYSLFALAYPVKGNVTVEDVKAKEKDAEIMFLNDPQFKQLVNIIVSQILTKVDEYERMKEGT